MLRIGSGAGFAGDRIEPAIDLVEKGKIDYLVLECLAERTIALAQQRKTRNPSEGYDLLLERRMESLLPAIVKHHVRIITNMGAANPIAGAKKIQEIAERLGLSVKVAAVTGDDVLDKISLDDKTLESDRPLRDYEPIISANAYIGIEGILQALETDADIVITGRAADPSLFLAPMVYHYKWTKEDVDKLANGTVLGHLMECSSQITGGYFADPVKKPVSDLANIGFPIAEIDAHANGVITKLEDTGGIINLATVKEQLLYEINDPTGYITPDLIVDITNVQLKEIGPNRVEVTGGKAAGKPSQLKVSVGYHAGYIGEGEISYAGSSAIERAEMAGDIVKKRLEAIYSDLRVDFIGCNSVHRSDFSRNSQPYEVRLRIAGKANSLSEAQRIGEEVEALYLNGPAGGGGARKYNKEVVGIVSVNIPLEKVQSKVTVKER